MSEKRRQKKYKKEQEYARKRNLELTTIDGKKNYHCTLCGDHPTIAHTIGCKNITWSPYILGMLPPGDGPAPLSYESQLAKAFLEDRVIICEIAEHQRDYATDRFRIRVEKE